MNKNKKMITTIIGLLFVVGFIVLIACNTSHSEVFKLQPGEAESLGVVFPEDGSLTSLYDKYMKNKEYDKALVVAKKMVELSSEKGGGYLGLQAAYIKAGKYEEALVVNKKLIQITPDECRYVEKRAMIFERMDKQEKAIKTFKKYRDSCPEEAEVFIPKLEEARLKGEKLFPVSE